MITTTSIKELEKKGALSSQSGYSHKEVLFAAAALAMQNKPDLTSEGLYDLLWDESDTAMAIALNDIHSDEAEWEEFYADAESFSSCF
jgi:hypothetical protein